MKKQFLRVLSIVLSLALFLGIMPTAALSVLAEAVGDALSQNDGDALTRVDSVVVDDIEVNVDNIGWRVEYTGTGEDPFGDMLTYEAANSWTQEDLDSFSWEIHSFVYDEDYNEVEVNSGHFEYLWLYGMGDGGDWISNLSPIGQTGAQWEIEVNQYMEDYPDDWDCLGFLEQQDFWTSDSTIPMLNSFHDLTGLPGDYYVGYTLFAYIRYVSAEGEVVMRPWTDAINWVSFESEEDHTAESIHTYPANWKYSMAITDNTVKASIGEVYTPAVYINYLVDREYGDVYGAGSVCCRHGSKGTCRCYEMVWVRLKDGVTTESFTGDPSQFIPIGLDEETWSNLLTEYGDDHKALYEYLFWDLGYSTQNNSVPLYTTEGLISGECDYGTNSFNLADYSEYAIAPIISKESEEYIFEDDELVDTIWGRIYNVGEAITIVPVEPGKDAPEGGEGNLPVFKEASPLPEEYIVGVDPRQGSIQLTCDARYGNVPISYQWYRSETPDYNGVAIEDGSGNEKKATYYADPPQNNELDKTYYYYCEYSFTNVNGVKETYYTTITKCKRLGALGIDVKVTPGEIYMEDVPSNTNNFKSYYARFSSNNLPLYNDDFTIPYAYQSKGSDSVLSAWIEPSSGYGKFEYSDYITYQWYMSDTEDYTTGTPVGDLVTISGLGDISTSRTSVNGLRSYPDFNKVNQYANIHVECPTDEVGEYYMTVVVKNYYTDKYGKQHVYETNATCRVTTFEKNEDLYHVTEDGMLDAYNGHENVMTIPAEVNGIKVTSLDRLAQVVKTQIDDEDVQHVAGARKIIFPEGLTEVSEYAFFRLYTLEEIVFSSTITTIGKMAFADTGRIKNLVIPANVTAIESGAFCRSRIEKVTFADDVWPQMNSAFYDSRLLNTVILPANATGEVGGAFLGCKMLIRVDNYENVVNLDQNKDFKYTPAAEYIYDGVGGCDGNFTYILNEDGQSWCITEIWGDYLEHVTIPESWKGLPVTVLGRGHDTDSVSNTLNARVIKWPEYLKSVTIPDTITTINAYAFEECVNLETFNFHSGIKYVGTNAFKKCYRLSSDVVLASKAKVYSEAFAWCYSIKKVNAPDAYLYSYSFDRCYNLESITNWQPLLPPANTSNGSYSSTYTYGNFWGTKLYSNYDEVYTYYESPDDPGTPVPAKELKSHFARSGNYIYQIKNNKAIHYTYVGLNDTKITFPSKLDDYVADKIDGYVFNAMLIDGYEVVFEEGITTLGSNGGSYVNLTTKVTLPNSLVELNNFFGGNHVQDGAPLKEVHIPASVKDFTVEQSAADYGAFRYCRLLEKVTFADGNQITTIDKGTFAYCESLTTIDFGQLPNLKVIDEQAFHSTAMTVLDLTPCTQLTTIGKTAFMYMPNIEEIYLPDSVTEIGDSAFRAEKWDGYYEAYYVETLNPLKVLKLSENLKTIGAYAFYGQFMDNIVNAPYMLVLPDSIEVIDGEAFGGYGAFANNDEVFLSNIQLAKEKLPASLKQFGSQNIILYAPFSYSPIDTLIFQPNIEEITASAMEGMDYLTKIVFEADEKTGSSSLRVLKALLPNETGEIVGWDNLKKLEVIGSLNFGDWKYDKEEYIIPDSVHRIESLGWLDNAFQTVIIPDGVEYIGCICCFSTPENPRKIIAYGTEASVPVLADKWLHYDHFQVEEYGYDLAPLYCYTGSAYHEWAVEHNYPYVLMDDGTDTITLKFYDRYGDRVVANTYFKSIKWMDKDGNVLSNKDLLSNVVEGEEYTYEVTFYDNKSWSYKLPAVTGTVTAIEGGASVNLTISPLEEMTVAGTFVNFDEPGFNVKVQFRQSRKGSWQDYTTLTAADLGENGEFSLPIYVKDVRFVMDVAAVGSKCVKTSKVFLSQSGRLENGVYNVGAVEMKYKGAESRIPSNTDLSLTDGLYVKNSWGSIYKVYGNKDTLNIYSAVEAGVKPGEVLTLLSATAGGEYYLDPFSFVVPYEGLAEPISPVLRQKGGIYFKPETSGRLYIFDEAGDYVTYINAGSKESLVPGTYTVIGADSRHLTVANLEEFEALNVHPDNYYRQTVYVAYDYVTVDKAVPEWTNHFGIGRLEVNMMQQDKTTGVLPIKAHYSLLKEVSTKLRFSILRNDDPFVEMNGQYVYHSEEGAVEAVEVIEDGNYTYLDVTVNQGGTITFYLSSVQGGHISMCLINPYELISRVELPNVDFSTSVPNAYTSDSHGAITIWPEGYATNVYAQVLVDGVPNGKRYGVSGNTVLPYTLETADDGSTVHDVQVVVYHADSDFPVWYSDVYTVTHTNKPIMTATYLDYTIYNENEYVGSVLWNAVSIGRLDMISGYYQSGSIGFSGDMDSVFDQKGNFRNSITYKYSLQVKNRKEDATVSLVVYDELDNTKTIPLQYNSATNTYDGALVLLGGTFRVENLPNGYDVRIDPDVVVDEPLSQTYLKNKAQEESSYLSALIENTGKQIELVDLDQLQEEVDAMDDLSAEERAEIMEYYAYLNQVRQGLNDMTSDLATDFEQLQNGEGMTRLQAFNDGSGGGMETISLADDPPTPWELKNEGYEYMEFNGKPMYVFTSDVSVTVVYLDEDHPEKSTMTIMTTGASTFTTEENVSGASTVKTIVSTTYEVMQDTLTLLDAADSKLNKVIGSAPPIDDPGLVKDDGPTAKDVSKVQKELTALRAKFRDMTAAFHAGDRKAAKAIAITLKGGKEITESLARLVPGVGTAVSVLFMCVDLVLATYDTADKVSQMDTYVSNCERYINTFQHYIDEGCVNGPYDMEEAKAILEHLKGEYKWMLVDLIIADFSRAACLFMDGIATILGLFAPVAGESAITSIVISGVSAIISLITEKTLSRVWDEFLAVWHKDYAELHKALPISSINWRCLEYQGDSRPVYQPEDPSPSPKKDPPNLCFDPAGYVYEAVASNRIQGATAKVYYEDQEGNEVFWAEAPDYGEINPQITDAAGRYAWITPTGNWRVRITKDGYYEGNSINDPAADENGWLPVPPPQLNVNIGLVSKAAPTVERVDVASDRIRVIFSQYMDIAQLQNNSELILVKMNGADVPVEFTFTDAEVSPTKEGVYYGRTLIMTPADGTVLSGNNVTVEMDATLKNYAGTLLGSVYNSGKLTVGQIAEALSHSYPNRLVVDNGETAEVALQVTDTEGKPMAGVTVDMQVIYGMYLKLDNTTAVSDENGRVVFTVTGKAIGDEHLIFTTADGLVTKVEVRVAEKAENQPTKPTANLSDYSVVDCGTQLIISTETEGATIYYTTNDTCPCTDSEERQVYTGPIELTESAFYRIAVWTEEGGYSERLNLHLTVEHDYDENGNCDRCGDSVGGEEPITDIITFGGNSVSEDVNGLAFRFDVDVDGMTVKKGTTTADYSNATVTINGAVYQLLSMGAIATNSDIETLDKAAVNDWNVVDIAAVYLFSHDEDSATYAVRIIDIPEQGKDTTVRVCAYYVVLIDGVETVIYDDQVYAQTYNGALA